MSHYAAQGIAYHCENCGETLYVEFEGGIQWVQIGLQNCAKQVELSKKYPSETPWIHEEGCICEKCMLKNITEQEYIDSRKLSRILDILRKLHKLQKETKDDLKRIYNNSFRRMRKQSFKLNIFYDIIDRIDLENPQANSKETAAAIYDLCKDEIYEYMFDMINYFYLCRSKRLNKDLELFKELAIRYNNIIDKDWHGIKICYKQCATNGKIKLNEYISSGSSKVKLAGKNLKIRMYKKHDIITDNLKFPKFLIDSFNYFEELVDKKEWLKDIIIDAIANILENEYEFYEVVDEDLEKEFSGFAIEIPSNYKTLIELA